MRSTAPLFLAISLALAPTAHAHFTLAHPEAFGSHSTTQSKAPCGDTELLYDDSTDYYVGGDAVAVITEDKSARILIRAVVGSNVEGNWTNLFPIVAQSGEGAFCEPLVPAPLEWVGRDGIIQVIQSGKEGLSYQVGSAGMRFCGISY
jgi:hypothetical protein